jgi:hypothetical protein
MSPERSVTYVSERTYRTLNMHTPPTELEAISSGLSIAEIHLFDSQNQPMPADLEAVEAGPRETPPFRSTPLEWQIMM